MTTMPMPPKKKFFMYPTLVRIASSNPESESWTPESLSLSAVNWWHYEDLPRDGSFTDEWLPRFGDWKLRVFGSDPLLKSESGEVVVAGPGIKVTAVDDIPEATQYSVPVADGFTVAFIARQDSFVPGDYHRLCSFTPDASCFIGAYEDKFLVGFGQCDGSTWNDLDPATESGGATATLVSDSIIVVSASLSSFSISLNGTVRNYRNGTGTIKTTYTDPFSAATISPTLFALDSSGTQWWDGAVQQVVIGTGVASTDDRRRLEGYLAHAAGLQSLLPVSHPYKTDAP